MIEQKSAQLWEQSKTRIPGGVNSPVRAFRAVNRIPRFIQRAAGSKIYDVDGNEYIDYVCSWGPSILGHAVPEIVTAVQEAAAGGLTFGAPTEKELILAQLVHEMMPVMEVMRLVNSGTEAVMSAIRVARGYTGRDLIVKFEGCYHGHSDGMLVKAGSGAITTAVPDSGGVPEGYARNTLVAVYNDPSSVEELFKLHGERIAAVIVEPVAANMGVVPPAPGFLQLLRELTSRHGSLLIFDEVITGFRLAPGGACEYFGIEPDLVTLGKIVGGGLPMGAFCGKREIMELIAPSGPVYQAGTFSGNPISVQAGISTLTQLDNAFYKDLESKGNFLRSEIRATVEERGLNIQPVGLASMLQIYFNENEVYNYEDAKKSDSERFLVYFRQLLKEGVFIPPSQFECNFISKAHSMEDIEKTSQAIDSALRVAFK